MPPANEKQVGGEHYKKFGTLQPWDVIAHFGLGYFDGNAVKYLLRWRVKHRKEKGRIDDLKKAIHYLEKLLEEVEKP